MFSCEFCKIFKNPFFTEQLRMTAYVKRLLYLQKQPPEVFHKKSVLRNLTKFTEKQLHQSLYFNKVSILIKVSGNLLKKILWHRCFPVNFMKFLRTSFLQNTSGQLFLYLWKQICHHTPWSSRRPFNLSSYFKQTLQNKLLGKFFSNSTINHRNSFLGITKPCTHLHPAPSTSTSSFQPPPSSLQHPRQYLNQNVTRNWAVSTNLGRRIKSCPFWLKIGPQGILEVLILNPDLGFLKFRTQSPFLGKFRPKNLNMFVFSENWSTKYLKDADFESWIRFLKFRPQNPFLGKFGPKNSKLFILSENWCTQYLKDADSEYRLRFLKFRP